MVEDRDGSRPEACMCTRELGLIEQMTELSVEEFYVELDLDTTSDDGSIRVVAITPKPKK